MQQIGFFTRNSAIEIRTHDSKVVSSNPVWAHVSLSKALYSNLLVSAHVYKWLPT